MAQWNMPRLEKCSVRVRDSFPRLPPILIHSRLALFSLKSRSWSTVLHFTAARSSLGKRSFLTDCFYNRRLSMTTYYGCVTSQGTLAGLSPPPPPLVAPPCGGRCVPPKTWKKEEGKTNCWWCSSKNQERSFFLVPWTAKAGANPQKYCIREIADGSTEKSISFLVVKMNPLRRSGIT